VISWLEHSVSLAPIPRRYSPRWPVPSAEAARVFWKSFDIANRLCRVSASETSCYFKWEKCSLFSAREWRSFFLCSVKIYSYERTPSHRSLRGVRASIIDRGLSGNTPIFCVISSAWPWIWLSTRAVDGATLLPSDFRVLPGDGRPGAANFLFFGGLLHNKQCRTVGEGSGMPR
jgi:hypothetical protein